MLYVYICTYLIVLVISVHKIVCAIQVIPNHFTINDKWIYVIKIHLKRAERQFFFSPYIFRLV